MALSAQGSLSAHGESRLYVKKDSPAGKLLDSRMVWGRVYLIHMLLQHTKVEEKSVVEIQNCVGTEPSAK